MSRKPAIPLIAIYNYETTILDGLHVPSVADLDGSLPYVDNIPVLTDEDLRAMLLAEIGEMTPVYSKPEVLKSMIEVWARAHKPEWVKLWQTAIFKYNPIWNKDGSYTETRKGRNSGKGSTTYGRTDTNNVTGFDTNNFSPNTQNIAGGQDSSESGGEYEETLKRIETGNIGVTMTQEMIRQERDIDAFNIYSYIIESFKQRFCLLLY